MCYIFSDLGKKTKRFYFCKFIFSKKNYLAGLWLTIKLTTDQCWSYRGVHLGAGEIYYKLMYNLL
jgi:hypothetical protein